MNSVVLVFTLTTFNHYLQGSTTRYHSFDRALSGNLVELFTTTAVASTRDETSESEDGNAVVNTWHDELLCSHRS